MVLFGFTPVNVVSELLGDAGFIRSVRKVTFKANDAIKSLAAGPPKPRPCFGKEREVYLLYQSTKQ